MSLKRLNVEKNRLFIIRNPPQISTFSSGQRGALIMGKVRIMSVHSMLLVFLNIVILSLI